MKCIFIEGLPGSGKTSFAKRLYKDLKQLNIDVHSFIEGDGHPIDLAWIAIFDEEGVVGLFDKFPSLVPVIQDQLIKEDGLYLLPYTKIKIDESTKGFYNYCERFEIYQVNDIKRFLETHIHRYETFVDKHHLEDNVYIFECVLLQNHINELLINYRLNPDKIFDYYKRLTRPFEIIDVQVIYIKQNKIEDTLDRIIEERRSTDKNLYIDWIDHVIDYVEKNPKYSGYEGVLQYSKDRQKNELKILKNLKGEVEIVELDDDYEQVYMIIKDKVLKN